MKDLPEEDPPKGAPEWLVTFSDLVSLLVTLFIMMLTFTTSETDDLVRVLDVLKGSFGFHENKNKPDVSKQVHESNRTRKGVSSPHLERPDNVKTRVLELQSDYLTLEDFEKGVRIIPDVPNGFVGGSDKLSEELEAEIRRLAQKLRVHPDRRFLVVGHCDPTSDSESHVGGPDLLGLSRARRVARIMGLSRVQLEKIKISSQGDKVSRTGGHSASEQDKNRRVEIIVFMSDKDKQGQGR
jgi:chemotaxis protein MotB